MQLERITILHTNDLHSHLEVWPRTAAIVRAERAQAEAAGRIPCYVDAGDHLDMSESTTYATRGEVNLQLLSQIGCQAFTIGNNEVMRLKSSELSALAARSPFPWFGANLRLRSGEPIPGLSDWMILPVGRVKLGMFGLSCEYGDVTTALGFKQAETAETIRRCVAELKAAGADMILFLSHLGDDADQALADQHPGIDLIIGGHSHTVLEEPLRVGECAIVQAGDFGRFVGVVEIDFDLEKGRIANLRGRLIAVDPKGGEADPEATATIAKYTQAARAAMDEVLIDLPAPLPHDPLGPSALGPLVAEALRIHMGAEVGLSVGGQAISGLPAGPLTQRRLVEVMQPLFVPALLEVQGRQLKDLLEQSEDPAYHGHVLWAGGMRPRGQAIGRITTAGLSYRIDPTAPLGHRVLDLMIGDQPLDPNRIYHVGAPSLLAFAHWGYSALADVHIVKRFMPEFVREVFEQALRDGVVRPGG